MKLANGVIRHTFGAPEKFSCLRTLSFTPRRKELASLSDPKPPFSREEIGFSSSSKGTVFTLPLTPGERLYGFGLQLKSFEQTGKKRIVRNNADPQADSGDSHAPAPFYLSTKGYAVLVDTARYAKFYTGCAKRLDGVRGADKQLGLNVQELYAATGGGNQVYVEIPFAQGADIYLFTGEDMRDALARYILYCGGGVLPPLWGLGIHYRTKTDFTAEEISSVVRELRDLDMPCDMIGVEPGWHTHAYSCTYQWDKFRFPDPDRWIGEMADHHIHLNLWQHVFTHPDSELYEPLREYSGDFEVWGGLTPDLSIPGCQTLISDYQQQNFASKGIGGVKLDECDGSDYTGGWSYPEFASFPSGMDGEQMHSLIGGLYQQAVNDAFEHSGARTWSLVRASGAGACSFPFVLYSDLYEHRDFIRGLCTAPLSGLLWAPEVRQCESREELIRRMQSAAVSPMMCLNNWMLRLPPWKQFDYEKNLREELLPDWEDLFAACKQAARLRMSLVPYLYTAFFRYWQTGVPPIRPLVLDHPDDPAVFGVDDQVMIGDSLMAAPCVAGETRREVTFPQGTWRCFYTGRRFDGGQRVTVDAPLERLPLFVQEGACIPLAKPLPYLSGDTVFDITLRGYGEGPMKAVLYTDDGESFRFRQGAYSLLTARVDAQGKVTVSSSGDYAARYRIVGFKRM